MPLTDTTVRHAKNYGKNYSLKDMDGLHLFVSAKGAKSWHFRFYWLGKQARISLGMYPAIGLKDARLARDQARTLVAQGIDPRASRREDRFTLLQTSALTDACPAYHRILRKILTIRVDACDSCPRFMECGRRG